MSYQTFGLFSDIWTPLFVIQPILVAGREMLVHISRIRKCTATIADIKDHLGISDPSHEQQLDLFSDLETVEGYNLDDVIYDNADDIDYTMNQSSSQNIQSDSVVQDQTPVSQDVQSDSVVQNQSQGSSSTVSVPMKDNDSFSSDNNHLSTQDIIDSHQNLVETQLNLTPSNANTNSSQQQNDIIPGVNAPLPIILKKGATKKPIKEKFSLVQSLVPKQSSETVKSTLYFRNSVELAPFQQTNLLLTSP